MKLEEGEEGGKNGFEIKERQQRDRLG